MNQTNISNQYIHGNVKSINKMIQQTYTMVAVYFLTCTGTSIVSYFINPPSFISLITLLGAFALMFMIDRNKNSASAIPMAIFMSALLGFGLGPTLNHYIGLSNGGQIIATSLGITAMTFFGLTGYVMNTKKDFSFMGGALAAGSIIAVVGIVGMIIASLFGVDVSGFSLAISAMIVILMTGYILYDTSNIVNGVYSNYIIASVSIFLSIYNLFISLLNLISAFSSND